MRLLDVHSLTLCQFLDAKKRPPYAILSHTWGDGEVSLQDLPTATPSMAGYTKIKGCCEQAIQDDFQYVWIDTCCIDKTSSSELSEAINSMYQWYQNAGVCYALLSDVKKQEDTLTEFSQSRWFTRGWTLQELLAPKSIVFFNSDWVDIGTKYTLQEDIYRITGISSDVLLHLKSLDKMSVAQRMSWAASRQTTRVEDIAYALMGIFGVNMPTLYGEGRNAFIRLQHEIMRSSDDHSLFAWVSLGRTRGDAWAWKNPDSAAFLEQMISAEKQVGIQNVDMGHQIESGLLASSPESFRDAQGVMPLVADQNKSQPPYSMTNKGLHIFLPLVPVPVADNIYQAILDCGIAGATGPLGIYLKRYPSGQYCRVLSSIVGIADKTKQTVMASEIYVKEIYPSQDDNFPVQTKQTYLFHFTNISQPYKVLEVDPPERWSSTPTTQTLKLRIDSDARHSVFSDNDAHNYASGPPPDLKLPVLPLLDGAVRVGVEHDPATQAIVVLGVDQSSWNPDGSGFSCGIYFRESGLDPSQQSLIVHRFNHMHMWQPIVFDVDRTAKQSSTGRTVSVGIRRGRRETPDDGDLTFSVTQHYHVTITLTASAGLAPRMFLNPTPNTIVPFLRLTVHVHEELYSQCVGYTFYPKENWTALSDRVGSSSRTLLWTPTQGQAAAILGLEMDDHARQPAIILHARGSKILSESSFESGNPQDKLLSYLRDRFTGVNAWDLQPPREAYKKDIRVGAEKTLQVEFRPRMLLNDLGHQMWLSLKDDKKQREMERLLFERLGR